MKAETHYIRTTPEHWIKINQGERLDVLPVHHGFVAGDHILYQPLGDRYNERLMRKKILKVETPPYPGQIGWVVITLDRSDKEKIQRNMLLQVGFFLLVIFVFLILGYT